MKQQQYQGDISVINLSGLQFNFLNNLDWKPLIKPLVVAKGETGNKHQLIPSSIDAGVCFATYEQFFVVKVQEDARVDLLHEEHGQITLEYGITIIGPQTEYDPIAKRRLVED